MTYSEKLTDPRWQRKRLEIMNRDKFQCSHCLNEHDTLHVHHKYYLPNTDPWEYPDEVLETLCYSCHANEENLKSCQVDFIQQLLRMGAFNGLFEDWTVRVRNFQIDDIELLMLLSGKPLFMNELSRLIKKHRQYSFDNPEELPF